jgi:hypothetical protein
MPSSGMVHRVDFVRTDVSGDKNRLTKNNVSRNQQPMQAAKK